MALERLVATHAAKMDTDPETLVLVEPDAFEEPGSEVVAELEPESELNIAVKPGPVVVDEFEAELEIEKLL